MAHFHSNALIGASGGSGVEPPGARSIRFNDDDSAFFSKTFGSTGNRTAWTWSGWVKRSSLVSSARVVLFGGYGANSDSDWLEFGFGHNNETNDSVYMTTSATSQGSTAVFRDLSAWYHYVANYDGSNLKIYINNVEVLTKSLSGNRGINGNWLHTVGRSPANTIRYFDGYLTDVYFLDGTTTTPSSFASADSNGVWQRGTFSGSYGTNGFHILDFENEAEIGDDSSGNGNDFTPNNISDTDGVGLDLLLDFPKNGSETDSGAGGEVSGNYCTWNNRNKGSNMVLKNGSLDIATTSGKSAVLGTIGMSSGKWYWETTINGSSDRTMVGIGKQGIDLSDAPGQGDALGWGYYADGGVKRNGGTSTSYGAGFDGGGDVIGCAFDADNGTLTFYKNGSSQGVAFTGLTDGPYFPATGDGSGVNNANSSVNFGQRPWAYSAPSNHKALCTTNLPTSTVADGSDYQDTLLYTGNGASSRTISGLSFSPDFLWIKVRNNTGGDFSPRVMDAVRGAGVYDSIWRWEQYQRQ